MVDIVLGAGAPWRRRVAVFTLRAAPVAGVLLRRVGRGFPGVVGPLLVSIGLGLAWLPLGVIAAGAILWAVDWRLPDEPARPATRAPHRPPYLRRAA